MTEYSKAIVAAIMAALVVIDQIWSINLGGVFTEEVITIILAVLSPILVWLVPNTPPAQHAQMVHRD